MPRWATAIGVGLLATACAGSVLFLLDMLAPGGGVFPLVFPAAMIATLFAGRLAGATAGTLTILFAWYYFLPLPNSFRFETPAQAVSVAMVYIACAITIALAEFFRRSVQRATRERDRQIAERDLFLEEFEHRVKNNFTLVASLLDMQRRRAGQGETAEALGAALARIESIARAHRHLYRGASAPGTVDMAAYLQELCAALAEALSLRGAVTLDCDADHAALPRDRAVSIGLVVNELVTNAVKHAFAGRDTGAIRVGFGAHDAGWRLVVADNGTGISPEPRAPRGDSRLGQRLIDGFVRQARGTVRTESGPEGTTVTVELEG